MSTGELKSGRAIRCARLGKLCSPTPPCSAGWVCVSPRRFLGAPGWCSPPRSSPTSRQTSCRGSCTGPQTPGGRRTCRWWARRCSGPSASTTATSWPSPATTSSRPTGTTASSACRCSQWPSGSHLRATERAASSFPRSSERWCSGCCSPTSSTSGRTCRSRPPLLAHLQRWHLILPPAHHALHHTRPFTSHYCITTGWLNWPLGWARFFPALEWCITACTGALPRRDDLDARGRRAGDGRDRSRRQRARPARDPGAPRDTTRSERPPAGLDVHVLGALHALAEEARARARGSAPGVSVT